MLIYTRCYNKLVLLNTLLILYLYTNFLFVKMVRTGQNRPIVQKGPMIPSRVQYMIMYVTLDLRVYRGHTRLICLHLSSWRWRTATNLNFTGKYDAFLAIKLKLLDITNMRISSQQLFLKLTGYWRWWFFRKTILMWRISCYEWLFTLNLEPFLVKTEHVISRITWTF